MILSDFSFVRVIPFTQFKELGSLPRFPDRQGFSISLGEITEEQYERSLIVFISHKWLRSNKDALGWDGKPHPDDEKGSIYQLCVSGVEMILHTYTSVMKECYIWFDYSCLDQDSNPITQVEKFDKVMQVCDCLFTPLCQSDASGWEMPSTLAGWEELKCSSWNEGQSPYLSRAWCRLEMFYARNVPLLEDSAERRKRMIGDLLQHRKEGRRPHFLYSSRQNALEAPLIVLPTLPNTLFQDFHPLQGEVTNQNDIPTLSRLVQQLLPFLALLQESYAGERDEKGRRNGHGKFLYSNGNVYEGCWKDDKKHGKGKYNFASGAVYEGDFWNDLMEGKGKYTYANGSIYDGHWKKDKMQGKGTYFYANGDVYEGHWRENKTNGLGKFVCKATGEVYEGEFRDGVRDGQGKCTYSSGEVYKGAFRLGLRHGKGKFTNSNGDVYEGDYFEDKRLGPGKLVMADGQVRHQDYDMGILVTEEVQEEVSPKRVDVKKNDGRPSSSVCTIT